jgi:hypothetical protein
MCRRLLIALIGLFVAVTMATAQTAAAGVSQNSEQAVQDGAVLQGIVSDSTGAVISGATITVVGANGQTKSAVTDDAGKFRITGLTPGTHTVSVTAPSFAAFTNQHFPVTAGESAPLNVQLKPARVASEVRVEGNRVVQVETENAEVSGTISEREIVSYGLNGRNFSTLITLAPGVSNQTGQDEAKVGVLGSAKYSVNGGRTEYNTFSIDGNDVLNPDIAASHGHTTLLVYPSVDSLHELKVLTSNYGALYGRSASGTVLADIKSGNAQFHGNAYEFLRNEVFNARNYFDQTAKAPLYRRHDFGATLGGPLYIPNLYNTKKDKTFFFISSEFRKERSPVQFNQGVPTDAERGFNLLTQTYGNVADFNDVCPPAGGGGSQTFSRAKFPDCPGVGSADHPGTFFGNRFFIDPIGTAILKTGLIPRANADTGCNSSIGSCYVATASLPTSWRQDLLKIDHNFGTKTRLSLSAVHDHWATTTAVPQWANQPNSFPTVLNNFQGPGVAIQGHVITVFSSSFLNDFFFGVTGQRIKLEDVPGPGVTLSRAGLDSLLFPPGHLFDNGFGGKLPGIVIGGGNPEYGGAGFGVDTSFEPWYHSRATLSFSDNLTKVLGKHTVQFGMQYVYAKRHEVNGANGPNTGNVQGVLTTRQGGSGNTFADFINAGEADTTVAGSGPDPNSGGIQVFQQDSTQSTYRVHYWLAEPYVQDDWKIHPRLVLNLGVRIGLFGSWQPDGRTLFNWQASAYDPALFKASGLTINVRQGYLQSGTLFNSPPVPLDLNHLSPILTNGLVECGKNGVPASCQASHIFNPAPRIGFAWDPTGKQTTSIRAGYGIFYEHGTGSEANAGSLIGNPPQILSEELDGGFSQYRIGRFLSNPPASFQAAFPLNVISIPAKTVWPYAQQWSLSVQHEISKNTAVSASYVGSKGTHLSVAMQLNQLKPVSNANNPFGQHEPISAAQCLSYARNIDVQNLTPDSFFTLGPDPQNILRFRDNPAAFLALLAACDPTLAANGVPPLSFSLNLLRPFQGIGTITAIENVASSIYHSMQFTLRHNRGPLSVGISYTYGHSIDSASDRFQSNFVDSFALGANRASSDFDQRHLVNVSYVYQLPFLEWRKRLRLFVNCTDWDRNGGLDDCKKAVPLPPYGGPAPLTRVLLGGWSISGITIYQSGTPFSVINGDTGVGVSRLDNAGLALGLSADSYPDIVSNANCIPVSGTLTFGPLLGNPCMFAAPRGLTQGNAGRNSFNNPSRTNFDVALLKDIPVGIGRSLQLRAEAFNLFNHTQFILFDPAKGNTSSNTVSCYGDESTGFSAGAPTCRPGNGFLHPVAAHRPRTLQLALKFGF